MNIGYVRISTADQNLDSRLDALSAVRAERVFSDTISRSTRKQPEPDKMLDQLCEGDVIAMAKYDHLASVDA